MENDYSEIAVTLGKKLKELYDDNSFIAGVLSYVLESDDDMKTILEFIETGDDVDVETVSVLAMDLCDAREQN